MRNYRIAFVLALAVNLVFAAILAGLWWRSRRRMPTETAGSVLVGRRRSKPPLSSLPAPSVIPKEEALVPVQLSPERMQSIGVKTGQVEEQSH